MLAIEFIDFPIEIPRNEGELFRCIMQHQIKPFWVLRNYFSDSQRNITDILISLESKYLYSVRNLLDLHYLIRNQNGTFDVYQLFQYFIFEISSIFDAYALLVKEMCSLSINNEWQISFRSKPFVDALEKKHGKFGCLTTTDFIAFLNLIKLFRDSYIHRSSPNLVVRVTGNVAQYNARFLSGEADQFRKLIKPQSLLNMKRCVLYDVENQVEFTIEKMSWLIFKKTIFYVNELSDAAIDLVPIARDKRNNSARLGSLGDKVEEVSNIFNDIMKNIIEK